MQTTVIRKDPTTTLTLSTDELQIIRDWGGECNFGYTLFSEICDLCEDVGIRSTAPDKQQKRDGASYDTIDNAIRNVKT